MLLLTSLTLVTSCSIKLPIIGPSNSSSNTSSSSNLNDWTAKDITKIIDNCGYLIPYMPNDGYSIKEDDQYFEVYIEIKTTQSDYNTYIQLVKNGSSYLLKQG